MPDNNPFFGATFAERKALREGKTSTKQIDAEADEVEDKAVKRATTKRATKQKG